ncbi:MAG: hypothetical protein L0214_14750 [candidate division NC10 bacterium]|nr:hypothetical protein [candidate division NC10 bacterium]
MRCRFLANGRGFTVVDLVISSTLFLVLVFAIYTLLESSRTTFAAGRAKVDVQQNARVALELMEMDLRLAGYGFPTDPAPVGPQLKITAASPTAITFRADLTNASTVLSADLNSGGTSLSVASAAGILAGDTIYLINGGQWQALTVTSAAGNTITVPGPGATAAYPRGSQVGRPKAIIYSWNAGTISKDDGEGGGLQPLAEGVPVFQLRYFDTADVEIPSASLAASLANIRRITVTFTAQSAPGWWRPQTFTLTSDVRPRNL